jgi:hypothetical protein
MYEKYKQKVEELEKATISPQADHIPLWVHVTEVSDDNRNCCYVDQSVSRNCAKADRTQL